MKKFLINSVVGIAACMTAQSPASAEIIKMTIDGMYDVENEFPDYTNENFFQFNYLINSNSIRRYYVEDYVAYSLRVDGEIYRSWGYLISSYYNDVGYFDFTENIKFHAVQGSFFSNYDDPWYLSVGIDDLNYPHVGGRFGYTDFLSPVPPSPFDSFVSIVFPDGTRAEARNFFLSYTTLSPGEVPEPATWLMLLLGFGVVGSALRRRSPSRRARQWRSEEASESQPIRLTERAQFPRGRLATGRPCHWR